MGDDKLIENHSTNVTSYFGSIIKGLLSEKKNIVVLVGAGISVSCGIPDFRSSQGLYNTLRCEEIDEDLTSAEDLFHLDFFVENPAPFYKFAAFNNLFVPRKPSTSHLFLKLLEDQSMLLRVYTQNIDGLEEYAGVSSNRVVYSHGSLKWAQCMRCKAKVDSGVILQQIIQKEAIIPKCYSKRKLSQKRTFTTATSTKGSRHSAKRSCSVSTGSTLPKTTNGTDLCDGIMRPCITFFGEKLHSNVNRLLQADRKIADALIVIGTSLSVTPMSQVIHYLPAHIPRILINRNYLYANENSNKNVVDLSTIKNFPPHTTKRTTEKTESQQSRLDRRLYFDAYLLGDCDLITNAIANELGWNTSAITSSHKDCAIVSSDTFDNTFVFPGAVLDENNKQGSAQGNSDEEGEQTETIHCDGCNDEIIESMKCNQCFDYDLCGNCFPRISKAHFRGNHSFSPC